MIFDYVIIGNSAGGVGAVEAIREVDLEGSITVISEEPFLPYSRPMITHYLTGEVSADSLRYRPKDFYESNLVKAILGKKAVSIDFNHRKIELHDGEKVGYEKLLLATGGKPFLPKIEGADKDGIFTFTNLSDAINVRNYLKNVKTAVVIGGGLIGISVAEALIKLGVEVYIVELKDRILSLVLDEKGSMLAEKAVREAGANILTSHTVREIVGKEDNKNIVGGAILDDGEKIPCDIVLIAIGVIPRTELATNSEIKINRGILVDRSMSTNVPNVYACGDVVEAYDFVYLRNQIAALWPNAYLGGRAAGFNMAGVKAQYPWGTTMNSLSYFGLSITSAGIVNPEQQDGFEILTFEDSDRGIYRRIVLREEVIVGMELVGDIRKSGVIYGLMKEGVNVEDFKHALLSNDFGLIALPKELRRKILKRGGRWRIYAE